MKLSFDRVSRPTNLVGVILLCGLTAVGCSKKEESTDDKTDDNNVEVVTTAPVVQCDDQMALTQLTHSVQSTLASQSQKLFTAYAQSNGESLPLTNVNNASGSVLVDIANPREIQPANAQGMVTCSASVSLTLPNQDVSRANRVYTQVEDRSLADLLRSEGIVLNNNMLVTDNFNYVVGMQGGQSVARVVGQPAILVAAADVIAKSQYQAVIDARRVAPNTKKPRPAPALPSEPKLPSQPSARSAPEQREPIRQTQPARTPQVTEKSETKPVEPAKPETAKPSKPVTDSNGSETAAKPAEKTNKLNVPKDENIEMVIIEEEGTY